MKMIKMRDLKKRLKELSFDIPKEYFFEEKKNGIRVASKTLMSVKVKGTRGIMSYNGELTHSFVLTFGRFSSKRFDLTDDEFFLVANGEKFKTSEKEGDYISFYKGFPVCLISIEKGMAKPLIGRGFKRKLKTKLRD